MGSFRLVVLMALLALSAAGSVGAPPSQAEQPASVADGVQGVDVTSRPKMPAAIMVDDLARETHDPHAAWRAKHAGHEDMHAEVFMIFVLTVAVSQVGLLAWKAMSPRSYQAASLVALWAIPGFLAFRMANYRFFGIWAAQSVVWVYILMRARQHPLQANTPKIVYSWFSISYHWWSKIGFVGWVLVFFHICCCRFISVAMSQAILYWAPLMVFYATYFGILIRDCAEACTDFVSNTLGLSDSNGIPLRRVGPSVCGICALDFSDNEFPLYRKASAGIVELECSHSFHDICIRGWCLIGKKHTCPTCKEKVDLRALSKTTPWASMKLVYIKVLDASRYMIVWVPLIIGFVKYVQSMLNLE